MLGKKNLLWMIKRPCATVTRNLPNVPGLTRCLMSPCLLEKVNTRKVKYNTSPNSPHPRPRSTPQPGKLLKYGARKAKRKGGGYLPRCSLKTKNAHWSTVIYQLQFPSVPKRERWTGKAEESREKRRGNRLLSGRDPSPLHTTRKAGESSVPHKCCWDHRGKSPITGLYSEQSQEHAMWRTYI